MEKEINIEARSRRRIARFLYQKAKQLKLQSQIPNMESLRTRCPQLRVLIPIAEVLQQAYRERRKGTTDCREKRSELPSR